MIYFKDTKFYRNLYCGISLLLSDRNFNQDCSDLSTSIQLWELEMKMR